MATNFHHKALCLANILDTTLSGEPAVRDLRYSHLAAHVGQHPPSDKSGYHDTQALGKCALGQVNQIEVCL